MLWYDTDGQELDLFGKFVKSSETNKEAELHW